MAKRGKKQDISRISRIKAQAPAPQPKVSDNKEESPATKTSNAELIKEYRSQYSKAGRPVKATTKDRVKFTTTINDSLIMWLKSEAALQKVTNADFLEQILMEFIANNTGDVIPQHLDERIKNGIEEIRKK